MRAFELTVLFLILGAVVVASEWQRRRQISRRADAEARLDAAERVRLASVSHDYDVRPRTTSGLSRVSYR